MDDIAIHKGEKESEAQGQLQRRSSDSGRSVGRSGGGGLTRRAPASLFSLTPRDFFSASPFDLMRRFTEDMDRFFEGTSPGWSSSMMPWSPPIEVSEKDGQLKVCAELPGLNKDDVKVELTPEGLTISGERKHTQEDRGKGLYRSERSYGAFSRTIPIPEDAQVEQANATFDNGILTVSVPVPEIKQRRREIPIESGSGSAQRQSSTAKAA
jgi:HSP20 family protein